jgi:hypothetical protein
MQSTDDGTPMKATICESTADACSGPRFALPRHQGEAPRQRDSSGVGSGLPTPDAPALALPGGGLAAGLR